MFSGIEAATVAWHPLGWELAAVCEIDKAACAVLAHHYPNVPNLGDITKANFDDIGPIDLAVFGSPCQSFSIAGKRLGMDDPRGNLALHAIAVLNRLRPRWFVFENVPGLLSSDGGRDFGTILGEMAKCGYGTAYRILDAQHFGVPQRRRRVFVVGHLGDWRRAAAVLFEREGLLGHSAPRRQTRTGVAALTANGVGTCGADDNQGQAGHLIAFGGGNTSGAIDIATAQTAQTAHAGRIDFDTETFIAHALRGEGFDASEDGTGRGTPIIAVQERATAENPDSGPDGAGFRDDGMAYALEARSVPQAVAFDLRGREDGSQLEGPHDTANIRASSGGSSRSYVVPINPNALRGDTIAKTPSLDASGVLRLRDPGLGVGDSGDPADTLQAAGPGAVAIMENQRAEIRLSDATDATDAMSTGGGKPGQGYPAAFVGSQVRRLTPVECLRLQGFPDHYFDGVMMRGRPLADGPKYKLIGNSKAVPVVRWIGERIAAVDAIPLS